MNKLSEFKAGWYYGLILSTVVFATLYSCVGCATKYTELPRLENPRGVYVAQDGTVYIDGTSFEWNSELKEWIEKPIPEIEKPTYKQSLYNFAARALVWLKIWKEVRT